MERFRKSLFWSLTLIYLIVCPGVVLYALGYLRAGLVTWNISPPDAKVRIANRTIAGPWPKTMLRVPAGQYQARVDAEGYAAHDRVVSVARGETTTLDRVLLLPDPIEPRIVIDAEFSNLTQLPGTQHLLLSQNSDQFVDLLAYDWKADKSRAVAPVDAQHSKFPVMQIDTVEGSPLAVAWCASGKKALGVLIDLSQNPPKTRPGLSAEAPLPLFWRANSDEPFFAFHKNRVEPLLPSKKAQWNKSPLSRPDWRGFGIGEDQLYALDAKCHLQQTSLDGIPNKKEQASAGAADNGKAAELFGETEFLRILPRGRDTLFFLGDDGRLLQNELPHNLAEEVLGIKLADKPDRAILWRRDKAGVIEEPEPRSPSGGQFEQGREVRWIYEHGANIRSMHFVYQNSHALVVDENRVLLFEVFPGSSTVVRFVTDILPSSSIAYSEEAGTMFYLDANHGRLSAISLLPKPANQTK